ncbi:UNVERIFIED_CONTAM: hypothetical protein HDU68_010995 [Siphonaria sp. JEL0065]|nr:hypothetical protein HDU68_010995 [Siphonaria sp. JEL0065]
MSAMSAAVTPEAALAALNTFNAGILGNTDDWCIASIIGPQIGAGMKMDISKLTPNSLDYYACKSRDEVTKNLNTISASSCPNNTDAQKTKIATELTLIWAYCDAVIAANPSASTSTTTATAVTSTYAPVSTATVRPVTSVYSAAAETSIVGAAAAIVALYLF